MPKSIAFIDIEVGCNDDKILDLGAIRNDRNTFHSASVKGFFEYAGFLPYKSNVEQLIASEFSGSDDCYSITPRWLSKNYPKIENVIKFMCNTPCKAGCSYCSEVQKFLAISHTAILSPVNVAICEES